MNLRLLGSLLFLLSLVWTPVAAQATVPLAPGEHEVELRGVTIWYLVRGSGPVLVIQPGGAGGGIDATIYVETLRPLEAAHTVVYYDPRGIGRSGRSDPALYTLDEYVEDLEALRRHLGIDALDLAGHSHGGSVALKYSLAYPERQIKDSCRASPRAATDTQHHRSFLAARGSHGIEKASLQFGTAEFQRRVARSNVLFRSVRQLRERVLQQVGTIEQTLGAIGHVHESGGQQTELFPDGPIHFRDGEEGPPAQVGQDRPFSD
jgi:pimeloyl-ACP methyl ester carboxylesterase